MAYSAPYRPAYEEDARTADEGRTVIRLLVSFAAVLATMAALVCLVGFQITSEEQAKSSLRTATAALTEIDLLLARHEEDIQSQMNQSGTGEEIIIPDFPIGLGLTQADVAGMELAELRELVLDRSADRLYEDGTEALRPTAEGAGSVGVFSVAGFTDRALGMLTSSNHTRFGIATAVFGVIAVALAVGAAMAGRGWGRLGTIGVIALLAGGGVALAAALVRVYASTESDDLVESAMLSITNDHATVALLNGAAVAVAGFTLVVLAAGLSRADKAG